MCARVCVAAVNKFLGWVNDTVAWEEEYAGGGSDLANDLFWIPLKDAFSECTEVEPRF